MALPFFLARRQMLASKWLKVANLMTVRHG
jgi:hypothetical protein